MRSRIIDKGIIMKEDRQAIRVGSEGHTPPVTRLIYILNQADLHSLLRRLYALGLPLISDKWVDED
jgi:hypothetical protein